MRYFTLIFVLLAASLAAHAAPRQVAKKAPTVRLKATPLSPQKLRGQIAYTQKRDVWVMDPDTRKKHFLFAGDVTTRIPNRANYDYWVQNFAFSPDLKSLVANVMNDASLNGSSEIFIFPLDGGPGRRLTFDNWRFPKTGPRWSPDGKRIVYTRGTNYIPAGHFSKEVRVMDADGSNNRVVAGTIEEGGPAAFDPFWSRDSKQLLFLFFKGNLDYAGYDGREIETVTAALDGSNQQSFDGNWSIFDVPSVARNGRAGAELVPHPDYERVRVLRVFSYAPKTPLSRVWTELGGFVFDGRVAPDAEGKRVAFGGQISRYVVDAQGFLRPRDLEEWDIYLADNNAGEDKGKMPRLLVQNARLAVWL